MSSLLLSRVAANLRRQAGQSKPAYSTRDIVAATFPDAMVAGSRLPAGIEELVSHRAGVPVIIYSRSLSGPQQRFAIAHALGHLLFDDFRINGGPWRMGDPASESRADAFACALLVPLDDLEPMVRVYPSEDPDEQEIYLDHLDEIASRFGVPAQIIDLRIRTLRDGLDSVRKIG